MFRDSEAGVVPELVRKVFGEDLGLEGGVRRGVMRTFPFIRAVRVNKGRAIKTG